MTMQTLTLESNQGRPIIFTPERIDQVRNLRERGHTAEQIAEIIGCTLGTLRVRCSQFGISLRMPKPSFAIMPKRQKHTNGGAVALRPRIEPSPLLVPQQEVIKSDDGFAIQISYRGKTRAIPINLSAQTLVGLIVMAEMNNMRVIDLIVSVLEGVVKHNLVEELVPTKNRPLPSE